MATTIPRPQGTRSGGSSLQAPRKTSLIARPSTPSRLSTVGPPGASLPTSKSLQKSVSVSSFSHQTKGSRTSLSPPTPLKLNRRLSTIGKTNPAPPSQHRDSDGDYKEIKRLSRKSTSNLSASTSSDDAGRLSVLPSPPPSRSGSAEGSYTSVTAINGSHSDSVAMRGGGGEGGGKEKEGKGNVVVSVRCRPDGDGSNGDNFWVVDPRGSRIVYKGGEGGDYIYDNVFGPNDDNSRVYDACAKRLVRRVMEGYHGTVFAYGMTGTGKTFSMQGTTTSPGVIPLAINDIFSFIRETPNREFLLRVSYLEIYNERIHDLLSAATPTGKNGMPEAPQEEIKLREDAKRGVYATPLKEEIVQSPTQLLRVIARGDMARRVAGTQFNARSSRSHAVVQVVVESRDRVPGGNPMGGKGSGGVRVSTLSLIDLAGSERAAESKERRQEGGHINRSLLTLGTVIARLSETKGKEKDKDGSHLPYRDSKLTRLLQPALSGNSLVSILCTIATGTQSATNETLNTLKFAARARNNIVSHAKKADDGPLGGVDAGSRVLLERYRLEIERLRAQLDEVAKQKEETEEREREEKERERHEEQMLEMQLARTALKERIEHLNRLILCSKSSGVNSARNSTATSHPGHMSSISTRSSLNLVGLSRAFSTSSAGSPVLPGSHHLSLTSEVSYHQPPMEFQEDEDSTGGEFGDGIATLSAQVKALQADVADKNRYIATLERRLLHARRSSHSRTSIGGFGSPVMGGGITEEASLAYMVAEKDREIVELRARLDDKERMLAALRSVARNRDTAEGPNSPRLSICSSCGGIGSQSAGTGSRVNSYIAPLPSSQDLGLGLGRIRTKSMDDGLSMAMQMMKHSHRNSMHRVSSGSMPLVGSSATITQTPLPFPPANGTSTRHSHPRLKPFILPWKLATREARDAAAAAAAAAAASVSAGASSVAQSASTPASAPLSRSVSLTSSLRSAHRESAINETPQQQQRVELEVEVHAVDADEEDDNKSHDGDEEDGEAVISGRLEPGDEVDVNVARLSMGSRLERHDSSGSLRRREGFLSGFRNGGDGGIGRPPEIGVEELGLGEIVDVR